MMVLKYFGLLLAVVHVVFSQSDGVFQIPSNDFDSRDEYDDPTIQDNQIEDLRMDVLESSVDDLNTRLDDLQRTDKGKYNELVAKVTNLSSELAIASRYTLPLVIAENLANKEFGRAGDMLSRVLLTDYDEVIYYSYKNDSKNFRTILDFADTVHGSSSRKTFHLYNELFEKSSRNNHANIDDFKDMVRSIILKYNDQDWMDLKRRCLEEIITKATEIITNNVNKYDSINSNAHMNSVYELDNEAGLRLMSEVIRKLYQRKELGSLVPYIHKHSNLHIRVRGFTILYDKIQQNNDLDDYNLFYLGTMIRITLSETNLDISSKAELDILKENLPKSIKAAALSWKVCIQNKLTNNTLKVSDQNRAGEWRVIVSSGDNMYDRSHWRFEAMHDGLYIMLKNIFLNRNVKVTGVSIYMSSNNMTGYKIGVSLPMNSGDNWLVEAAGDYCYIKSRANNKYLSDYEGGLVISDMKNEFSMWRVAEC